MATHVVHIHNSPSYLQFIRNSGLFQGNMHSEFFLRNLEIDKNC